MARRPTYKPASESEATIRRLSDELFLAREAIIELMGEEARAILSSHYRCNNRMESRGWAGVAAMKLMDLCHPVSQLMYQGQLFGSRRAKCPLCHKGPAASMSRNRGSPFPMGYSGICSERITPGSAAFLVRHIPWHAVDSGSTSLEPDQLQSVDHERVMRLQHRIPLTLYLAPPS